MVNRKLRKVIHLNKYSLKSNSPSDAARGDGRKRRADRIFLRSGHLTLVEKRGKEFAQLNVEDAGIVFPEGLPCGHKADAALFCRRLPPLSPVLADVVANHV